MMIATPLAASGRQYGCVSASSRSPLSRVYCTLTLLLVLCAWLVAAAPVPHHHTYRDNWGTPQAKVAPHETDMSEVTRTCFVDAGGGTKSARSMEDALDEPALNFYPSTAAWARFEGTNMLRDPFQTTLPFAREWRHYGQKPPDDERPEVLADACERAMADGTTWSVERIGPFHSTGGYDWWQFAWNNVLDFRGKIAQHGVLNVLNTFSGAVDARGHVLGFPPIHVHHVHLSPGNRTIFAIDIYKCWHGTEDDCSHAFHTFAEQHGDYQCVEAEGGARCLLENLPSGYAKQIDSPVTINGELNDVRAGNSSELTWYYQVAARWAPAAAPKFDSMHPSGDGEYSKTSALEPVSNKDGNHSIDGHAPRNEASPEVTGMNLKALSHHYMWSPGRTNLNDQSTMVNTFLAPTDRETFMFYSGMTWSSGKLIRGKMHSHNTIFKESMLFAAWPHELGLTNRFAPSSLKKAVYDVIDPNSVGFADNDALKHYILKNYEASQAHKSLNTEYRDARENRRPELICHAGTSYDTIDGYFYDRRARTWCRPWVFEKGDPFTVVGFNSVPPDYTSPGPHLPANTIPPYLPGHLHWFILWEAYDNKSHYTYAFYSQDPHHSFGDVNGAIPYGSLLQAVAMFVWGGMLTRPDYMWFKKCVVVGAAVFVATSIACLAIAISTAVKALKVKKST